jgi:hypothetical protein
LDVSARVPRPVPPTSAWLLSALGVFVAALVIRQFVPTGRNIFGLQLGYFASYIFLFAVGISAWRHDWLNQLSWKNARPWIAALIIAWPGLPISIFIARSARSSGSTSSFSGGLSWQSVTYAMWEPFVAWGLIAAWLLVFRDRMNQPSSFWNWVNRRAYAVYIIHPPILVAIALMLHQWNAPALIKFAAIGALVIPSCWFFADPLVRLPLSRRIV